MPDLYRDPTLDEIEAAIAVEYKLHIHVLCSQAPPEGVSEREWQDMGRRAEMRADTLRSLHAELYR